MAHLMHSLGPWSQLSVLLTTVFTLAACTQAAPVVAPTAPATSVLAAAATAEPTAARVPTATGTVEPPATSTPVPTASATSEPTATPTVEPTITRTPKPIYPQSPSPFMPGKYAFVRIPHFYFTFGEDGQWSRWEGEQMMSQGTYRIEGNAFVLTSLRKVDVPTPCPMPVTMRYSFDGKLLTFHQPPLVTPAIAKHSAKLPFSMQSLNSPSSPRLAEGVGSYCAGERPFGACY
jgi:hypothetical protein